MSKIPTEKFWAQHSPNNCWARQSNNTHL